MDVFASVMVICGCMFMLASMGGGSVVHRDTGYRIGGVPVTRRQYVDGPGCQGFIMGLLMFLCGGAILK
jgi:hypothetical protein